MLVKGFSSGFCIIFLFFSGIYFKQYVINSFLFKDTYTLTSSNDLDVLCKNSLVLSEYEKISIVNYINVAHKEVNTLFEFYKSDRFRILIEEGNCSGLTYPDLNVVKLQYKTSCLPPILHEFVHVKLGEFKEFWMLEGTAVYYSSYLKKKSKDVNKYVDSQDDYLNGYHCSDSELIIPICNFDKLLSKSEAMKLVDINDSDLEYSSLSDNVYLFYALSGSFVEKIINTTGESYLLSYIKSEEKENITFKKYLARNSIDLDEIYTEWINEVF